MNLLNDWLLKLSLKLSSFILRLDILQLFRQIYTPYTHYTLHTTHLNTTHLTHITSYTHHTLHTSHLTRITPYTQHTLHTSHLAHNTPHTHRTLHTTHLTHSTLHLAHTVEHQYLPHIVLYILYFKYLYSWILENHSTARFQSHSIIPQTQIKSHTNTDIVSHKQRYSLTQKPIYILELFVPLFLATILAL